MDVDVVDTGVDNVERSSCTRATTAPAPAPAPTAAPAVAAEGPIEIFPGGTLKIVDAKKNDEKYLMEHQGNCSETVHAAGVTASHSTLFELLGLLPVQIVDRCLKGFRIWW